MPVLDDENGRPYAVHLCKTDIAQNNNKFYDMELSNGWGAQEFAVKLINGRIGYRGVTNFKYFGDLTKAKKFFHQKFHEKTALQWEERDEEPVPGKYVVVELTHTAKPEVKKEEPEVKKEPKEPKKEPEEPKTRGRKKKAPEVEIEIKKEVEVKKEEEEMEEIEEIDEKVKDLMRCICDEDIHLGLLRQLKFNEEFGRPIDCLSPAQIDTGYEILAKIEESIGARRPARSSTRNRAPLTAPTGSTVPIAPETRLQLTNKYYSLIPHAFGFSIPPKIDSLARVQSERELLDALKGSMEAAQNKKEAEKEDSRKDIYQRLYERLPCQLEPVGEEIAQKIGDCLKMRGPTHLYNLSLIDAFKLKEPEAEGKEEEMKKEEKVEVPPKRPRRGQKAAPTAPEPSTEVTRLLWHGTRVTNVFSILMNGLVFPEGDRYGLMFGNGVYFANVPTKSANYCCPEASKRVFMLLCEVKVQNPLVLYESEVDADEKVEKAKKDSVYAAGKHRPTGMVDIEGTLAFRDGLTEIPEQTALLYDEYVMFDKDRFKIKYVVEVNVEKMRRLPK